MSGNSPNIIFSLTMILIYLILVILFLVAFWKVFRKAGRPGWYSLIPFFNVYQLIKMTHKPGWWLLLMFVPMVQLLFSLLIYMELAKAFGRSAAFGALLLWLFPIGFLIIGFGKSAYAYGTVPPALTPTPPPVSPPPSPKPTVPTQ